jgi:uncharacterized protein
MKICINEIMQDGLDLKEEINPKELGFDAVEVRSISDIRVKAHIEKEKDIVTVSCNIKANEKRTCSRCLNEFVFLLDNKENFVYSLSGEHIIELNDDIKDTIILDCPIRQLCKPGCKGLCPYCGKNLNEGPCGCKDKRGTICRE